MGTGLASSWQRWNGGGEEEDTTVGAQGGRSGHRAHLLSLPARRLIICLSRERFEHVLCLHQAPTNEPWARKRGRERGRGRRSAGVSTALHGPESRWARAEICGLQAPPPTHSLTHPLALPFNGRTDYTRTHMDSSPVEQRLRDSLEIWPALATLPPDRCQGNHTNTNTNGQKCALASCKHIRAIKTHKHSARCKIVHSYNCTLVHECMIVRHRSRWDR